MGLRCNPTLTYIVAAEEIIHYITAELNFVLLHVLLLGITETNASEISTWPKSVTCNSQGTKQDTNPSWSAYYLTA